MGTIFKINGKNTGKDVSVTITDSNGNQVNASQLGILMEFDVETDYTMSETKSISNDGQCFYESLPHGSKCMMKFSRSNGALEEMESYYRSQSKQGIQLSYTIQYQTLNRDGTTSGKQLVGCKPHNWKLGSYKADQDVSQSVDFVASDSNNTGDQTGLFG